jgi:hypothetical protein
MKMNQQFLTAQELENLQVSLHYCKVGELRNFCEQLHITHSGTKPALIKRIIIFIQTGICSKESFIPASSRKKVGEDYPLHPDTLMVYGDFKNRPLLKL